VIILMLTFIKQVKSLFDKCLSGGAFVICLIIIICCCCRRKENDNEDSYAKGRSQSKPKNNHCGDHTLASNASYDYRQPSHSGPQSNGNFIFYLIKLNFFLSSSRIFKTRCFEGKAR